MESDSNYSDVDEPNHKKASLADLFRPDVLMTGGNQSTTQSLTSQIYQEIVRYRKKIHIPLKDPATDWWRKKSFQYPLLGKLAHCYLAILGTSVPSQRVFSTAGAVVTAPRTTLKPSNVDMLDFLNEMIGVL